MTSNGHNDLFIYLLLNFYHSEKGKIKFKMRSNSELNETFQQLISLFKT